MKTNLTLAVALLFLLPLKSFAQCGNAPDFTPWFNDDPNFEGVGVFLETSVGTTYAGTALSSQNNTFDIDLSEVTGVVFATLCRGGSILTIGSPNFVGSLCSQTFECPNDLHFYTPPTTNDPYNYSTIDLAFPPFFGTSPSVSVELVLSGCGLPNPTLATPANEAENTGTSVLLDWNSVPMAVEYDVRLAEACNGCPITSTTTAATQLNVAVNSNSSYFWQVRAKGSGGTCLSAWSTSHFWSGTADPLGVAICNFFDAGRWTSAGPIRSDWPVLVFENVVFCSNISVTLNPGFEVGTGGSLVISTDGCDD